MEEPPGRAGVPIPVSALQHAVYCLRQCALIHLERLWVENRFTAEGQVMHLSTHQIGQKRRKGVRQVSALPIFSSRLNLAGVADLVEFIEGPDGEVPYPVEFKRGKAKQHRADEVQLCAQGLCLEEMTGRAVPEGALFYGETRRRVCVPFDAELRSLTERTITQVADLFADGLTPPADYAATKCRACSLRHECHPKIGRRSVRSWRSRALEQHLDGTGRA